MEKKKKGLNMAEVLFFVIIIMVGALLFLVIQLGAVEGKKVIVSVDGVEKYQFDLRKEIVKEIKGAHGGRNVLHIDGKKAWIEDASCPDKLCEKQHAISREGQSIVCLPNRVVVEIRTEGGAIKKIDDDVDAVAK